MTIETEQHAINRMLCSVQKSKFSLKRHQEL